jgi:hypothetical protein
VINKTIQSFSLKGCTNNNKAKKGYLEAAKKLQLKIGSNSNEISEMTTTKKGLQGLPYVTQSNLKAILFNCTPLS